MDGTEVVENGEKVVAYYKRHKKRCCKGLELIQRTIDNNHLTLIENAIHLREAWLRLQLEFEEKNADNIVYFKTKLYTSELKEGEPMSTYIAEFETLNSKLTAAGSKVSSEDLAVIMLKRRPPSFETL